MEHTPYTEHKLSDEEIDSLADKILALDPQSLKEVIDFMDKHHIK